MFVVRPKRDLLHSCCSLFSTVASIHGQRRDNDLIGLFDTLSKDTDLKFPLTVSKCKKNKYIILGSFRGFIS